MINLVLVLLLYHIPNILPNVIILYGFSDSVSAAEGQLCMEIVLLIEAAFYCLPFHGLVALPEL